LPSIQKCYRHAPVHRQKKKNERVTRTMDIMILKNPTMGGRKKRPGGEEDSNRKKKQKTHPAETASEAHPDTSHFERITLEGNKQLKRRKEKRNYSSPTDNVKRRKMTWARG